MKRVLYLTIFGAGALALCIAPLMAWPLAFMTGGGSVFGLSSSGEQMRVTHGFELHCDPAKGPNNLEVNWDGGNHFHLTQLTGISCYSDGKNPAPPGPSDMADVFNGCGTGTYNGQTGYQICFVFTDHGEPGTNDTAMYFISGQTVVLNVPTTKLMNGNQQAHPEP